MMKTHVQTRLLPSNAQRGVGIIEVLLAVVIISFGFLASAQMQVQGMRFNQSAYFQSQANMMLKDITDRMRANRTGVLNGNYTGKTTGTSYTVPNCIANETPCSPAELAQRDLADWSANFHAPASITNFVPLLPSTTAHVAQGSITVNADVFTISVQWNENIEGTDKLQQLSVQFMP